MFDSRSVDVDDVYATFILFPGTLYFYGNIITITSAVCVS